MFRVLLVIKSTFGVLFAVGLYGMAWDLASRGKGFGEAGLWFYCGLLLLVGFGALVASTTMIVDLDRIKEEYGGY